VTPDPSPTYQFLVGFSYPPLTGGRHFLLPTPDVRFRPAYHVERGPSLLLVSCWLDTLEEKIGSPHPATISSITLPRPSSSRRRSPPDWQTASRPAPSGSMRSVRARPCCHILTHCSSYRLLRLRSSAIVPHQVSVHPEPGGHHLPPVSAGHPIIVGSCQRYLEKKVFIILSIFPNPISF
jgi:hypothetical protein